MEQIAIVGLGYVGLPISVQFAKTCTVIGIDADPVKIDTLNAGLTYIKDVPARTIRKLVRSKKLQPTTNICRVRAAQAIIICVPTPLTNTREPDLSYVLNTGRAIAPHLQPGTLVVLESTTYPGTTDEDLRAVLEEGSGMKAGTDFNLAFSPERQDPGNPKATVETIPKVVGGYTSGCLEKAIALYAPAFKKIVPVSSCRAAEATKLLENIFRSVNIALVNELKIIYTAMGIDIWEIIEAANTKPFGFMAFYPGPGLGGHCIPIDPFYLAWKARKFSTPARFIELAGEINRAMPGYVVERLRVALQSQGKSLSDSRVLLLGLAYKPDVDDMRGSPTFDLLDRLDSLHTQVAYYDPHLPVIGATREHMRWAGTPSIAWREEAIRHFDAVVIVTAHSGVDYQQLVNWSQCIVDTRNVFGHGTAKGVLNQNIWNA